MSDIAVALGSGGARGWCHIGVLRQLETIGIMPDRVAGCSMGAIVGAAWAANKLDELEAWARALTKTRYLTYIDFTLEKGGLVRGRAVADILRSLGLPERIEDLARPFTAVATDMATGKTVQMSQGNLYDAVRASISIPGVFSPYNLDGKWLLDGGMSDPVPVQLLREQGAGIVIASNPCGKSGMLWEPKQATGMAQWLAPDNLPFELPEFLSSQIPPQGPQPPSYFDVLSTSIDILVEYVREQKAVQYPADVTLDADLNHMMALELFHAQEAIEEGHRMVKDAEPALLALQS